MNEPVVYKNYFENYTSLVLEKDIHEAFANQAIILQKYLKIVTDEKAEFSYAEGKWTLKEMLQHMIDTERIFAYRALAIARKETATLPGFDENLYAISSQANNRSWKNLEEEMLVVRKSTELLYHSFTDGMLQNSGNFSSASATVNTLGFIIIGHIYHHIKIAQERYL